MTIKARTPQVPGFLVASLAAFLAILSRLTAVPTLRLLQANVPLCPGKGW
ncbi:hypothetical protein [uncultured Cohaesibacter sp.]|nr:hypothetical protein [uncultured Cohaesibacter sp.]